MTLTELKYIVAVARERHFGKAADACFVSQPTLSVAVKKLEDDAWSAADPEKQARQEGLAGAIEEKISKLESEKSAASTAGDKKKVAELEEAISTQKSWLAVLAK